MAFRVEAITKGHYWLRYVIESDGVGARVVEISNARLLADAGEYLREMCNFSGTFEVVLACVLPLLRVAVMSVGSPPDAWSCQLQVDADGRPYFVVEKKEAAPGMALFEMEWVHPIVR